MVINGKVQKLRPKYDKRYGWGVATTGKNPSWVNDEGDGWTTGLGFHGRTFESKEHAQAFVDGYNQMARDFKFFMNGAGR